MPAVNRPTSTNELLLTNVATLDFTPGEMQADWVRWCYTSINKHFDDRKEQYDLYIEGDERVFQDEAEFAELRIDGPNIFIPQKNLYYLDIQVNLLCQTHIDPREHYRGQIMVGTFMRAFRNTIPVYKYGDGPLDDGSLLGCLHLQRDRREKIEVSYFGVIKTDIRMTQTTVEGHYRLELWTKETN
jgi:hypothetical protein